MGMRLRNSHSNHRLMKNIGILKAKVSHVALAFLGLTYSAFRKSPRYATYLGESFTNTSGGVDSGTIFEGQSDFGNEFGSIEETNSVFINMFYLQGKSPLEDILGDRFVVSNLGTLD
jgi:hypothetical protein